MQVVKKIKVLCEDTFFRGAFCGAVAGILKDIIDFIFYIINFEKQFFWTFASVVAYGQSPKGLLLNIIGILLEIIFSAFLGVLFALIAHKIKSRHYLLMGIFYGSMAWFFIRAAIICYKINELKIPHTPFHPFITWLLSMLFGIVLTWLERRLSPKTS
jgi:hypothetical protein